MRTGRGWPGRLILAAAFGVAMPTLVDRSLFTVDRADIAGWNDLVGAAQVGGIGLYAALPWVTGHVLLSVAAPLVVAETVTGSSRPWLGPVGIAMTSLGMVTVAAVVNRNPEGTITAGAGEYVVAGLVVLALVALALSPVGRPLRRRQDRTPPRPLTVAVVVFSSLLVIDLTRPGWPGLAVVAGVLALGATFVVRWARAPAWSSRHLAAAAWALLLERVLVGLLSPLTPGTTALEKYLQSSAYLVLVVALGVVMLRVAAADRGTTGRVGTTDPTAGTWVRRAVAGRARTPQRRRRR